MRHTFHDINANFHSGHMSQLCIRFATMWLVYFQAFLRSLATGKQYEHYHL